MNSRLRNVTLEMSLKPFFRTTDEAIDDVCRQVFQQWLPLVRNAAQVSVLLWTADGSEILTYQGDLDTPIEWARYVGNANPKFNVPGDPKGIALHSRSYLYTERPAVITYRDLGRIVAAMKRVGHRITGLPVRVGETFDPGCEFAKSPFKYKLHNEICLANTGGPKSFACCYAVLNADQERYAGFPDGIPRGTPLGTFLGRQCQHMLRDLGFDYIWFSNGFGFGLETWMTKGPMFDGRAFDASRAGEIRQKILDFWRLFRDECPAYPIETRGTNLSTGIDLASDAVPLGDIYRGGFNVAPPPNSPWAALNGDFGLELAGYMSHVAELPPGSGFPFRFYTHDPWWLNSPWLDRYGREPHDIYMPLSVSRIDDKGNVQSADSVLFLTIDDSLGRMPEQVPNEVIPHVQEAIRRAPDHPGPVVWVYPFDEVHRMTFSSERPRTDEAFFGDWFVRSAITSGMPINTVVSTRNFLKTCDRAPDLYRDSVLVTRVPDAGSEMSGAMMNHVQRSAGRVILYGPVNRADPKLLELLGVRAAEPVSGALSIDVPGSCDALTDVAYPRKILHRELMCAGGHDAELIATTDDSANVLATVSAFGQHRVAALVRKCPSWGGGAIALVRGTNAASYGEIDLVSGKGHLPTADDPGEFFHGDLLMRFAWAALGEEIGFVKRSPSQPNPITCIARHDNAFYFSGFVPDMTVEMRLRLSYGAPVFVGCDTELIDGRARYRMPRAWRRECRVFVEQETGVVSCHERTAEMIGVTRRLRITGLGNATVRVFPENNDRAVSGVSNGAYPYFEGPFVEFATRRSRDIGRYLEATGLSGELVVWW